jgi:hypothetical protein
VSAGAPKDIGFVAEHLPEAAMDQRFAALPLWNPSFDTAARPSWQLSAAFSRTSTSRESLQGPLLSVAFARSIAERWSLTAYAFFDNLDFSGSPENRPLIIPFAVAPPFATPVDASIGGLSGRLRDWGGGLVLTHKLNSRRFPDLEWSFGLQWQQVELSAFRTSFQILSGPQAGLIGSIDYSGNYTHITPMLGVSAPHRHASWVLTPHALAAVPLPKRGVAGRITSAAFDVAGNTDAAGNGKHFGDPYLALGFSIEYLPWKISVDVGALIAQRIVEPRVHEGINENWLINVGWRL